MPTGSANVEATGKCCSENRRCMQTIDAVLTSRKLTEACYDVVKNKGVGWVVGRLLRALSWTLLFPLNYFTRWVINPCWHGTRKLPLINLPLRCFLLFDEPPNTRPVRTVVWEAHWRTSVRQPSNRLAVRCFLLVLSFFQCRKNAFFCRFLSSDYFLSACQICHAFYKYIFVFN